MVDDLRLVKLRLGRAIENFRKAGDRFMDIDDQMRQLFEIYMDNFSVQDIRNSIEQLQKQTDDTEKRRDRLKNRDENHPAIHEIIALCDERLVELGHRIAYWETALRKKAS